MNGYYAGRVRVFDWIAAASDWIQRDINIDGEAEDDESGSSVSLSADGSVVAIGANENGGNGDSAGHVRVYEFSATGQIMSTFTGRFYGSRSNICLTAMAIKVGKPIKMRPCTRGHRNQMWFMD
jgi:hypothetical protein